MNSLLRKVAKWMRIDKAESSVMQTITVAISAILIAAGTATAPSIINNQKENTARSQLGNMAFAQQAWKAAYGFANTNFIPGQEDGSLYPSGSKIGQPVPNLSNWKYPYNFSDFAFTSIQSNFNCYKGEYVVWGVLKTGKTYYVSSDTAVAEQQIEEPVTCRAGYVPDVDAIPTSPVRLAAPTDSATALAINSSKESMSWTGVTTCVVGTTPAYQVRAKIGSATSKDGAWSSSTTQSLGYLNDAHKASGKTTVFSVGAKCRNDKSGSLSVQETVTPNANKLTITS